MSETNGNGRGRGLAAIEAPEIPAAPQVIQPAEIELSSALIRLSLAAKASTGDPNHLRDALDCVKAILRTQPSLRKLVVDALAEALPLIEKVGDENAAKLNNVARQIVGIVHEKRTGTEG